MRKYRARANFLLPIRFDEDTTARTYMQWNDTIELVDDDEFDNRIVVFTRGDRMVMGGGRSVYLSGGNLFNEMDVGNLVEEIEVVTFAIKFLKEFLHYVDGTVLKMSGHESATDDELVELSQQCEQAIDHALEVLNNGT